MGGAEGRINFDVEKAGKRGGQRPQKAWRCGCIVHPLEVNKVVQVSYAVTVIKTSG